MVQITEHAIMQLNNWVYNELTLLKMIQIFGHARAGELWTKFDSIFHRDIVKFIAYLHTSPQCDSPDVTALLEQFQKDTKQ